VTFKVIHLLQAFLCMEHFDKISTDISASRSLSAIAEPLVIPLQYRDFITKLGVTTVRRRYSMCGEKGVSECASATVTDGRNVVYNELRLLAMRRAIIRQAFKHIHAVPILKR